MDIQDAKTYDPMKQVSGDQFPDDTITIVIKCGGKVYFRGVNLEETHERTAKLTVALMQQVTDTVDTNGLKAGGPEPTS